MSKTPTASKTKNDQRRSELMARIRSSDTRPEIIVRRMFHGAGLRFRLHKRDLPGRPDLVFARHRMVVFVHGCFWHQHRDCVLASKPKSNRHYWEPKLAANMQRDRKSHSLLRAAGWRVETIWECETRKPAAVAIRLQRIIGSLKSDI